MPFAPALPTFLYELGGLIRGWDVAAVAFGIRGAVYHITSWGDQREAIFEDNEDRLSLLEVLSEGLLRFDAWVFAWCLMSNHHHFVLHTHHANLSRLIRYINGIYPQRYNRRHGKVGPLFQGRFKDNLVQEEAYLAEVCSYVDLNPVCARMVKHPGNWPWSSYNVLTGRSPPAVWHNANTVLQWVALRTSREEARLIYAEFVAQSAGVPPWGREDLRGQIYLGDEKFAVRMKALLKESPGVDVYHPNVIQQAARLRRTRGCRYPGSAGY